MSKIYANYEDRYVQNVVIHVKNENSSWVPYKDEEHTDPYTSVELMDAYTKGAILSFGPSGEEGRSTARYAIPVWGCIDNMFAFLYFHYEGDDTLQTVSAPDPKLMQ